MSNRLEQLKKEIYDVQFRLKPYEQTEHKKVYIEILNELKKEDDHGQFKKYADEFKMQDLYGFVQYILKIQDERLLARIVRTRHTDSTKVEVSCVSNTCGELSLSISNFVETLLNTHTDLVDIFTKITQNVENVVELSIQKCGLLPHHLRSLISTGKLQNTKTLDISHNYLIGPESIQILSELPNLTELRAGNCCLNDKTAIEISKLHNLERLIIKENPIGAEGMTAIAKMDNLRLLNIRSDYHARELWYQSEECKEAIIALHKKGCAIQCPIFSRYVK